MNATLVEVSSYEGWALQGNFGHRFSMAKDPCLQSGLEGSMAHRPSITKNVIPTVQMEKPFVWDWVKLLKIRALPFRLKKT